MTTGHPCACATNERARVPCKLTLLLSEDEVSAAVLLPALFRCFGAGGLFLAIADRLDAVGGDAGADKSRLGCSRTIVTEREVVFGRSTLVAVTLDRDSDVRVLLQEGGICLDDRLAISANVVPIVVEEY